MKWPLPMLLANSEAPTLASTGESKLGKIHDFTSQMPPPENSGLTHGPPGHVPPCQEVSVHCAALGSPHGLKEGGQNHKDNSAVLGFFFFKSISVNHYAAHLLQQQPFIFQTHPDSNSQYQQKIDRQHHNIHHSQSSCDTRGCRGSGGHAGHVVDFHFSQSESCINNRGVGSGINLEEPEWKCWFSSETFPVSHYWQKDYLLARLVHLQRVSIMRSL